MTIAIIGGSGFRQLADFSQQQLHSLTTDYGEPSAPIMQGAFAGQPVFFLARHGEHHSIQPHNVNYRANISALAALGVTRIVALAAVGGIDLQCAPGQLIIPDQIIDYTHGREATFFDQPGEVKHAEFTEPYTDEMRKLALTVAEQKGIDVIDHGVYAAVQGPRFETAAEIRRYQQDGATLVGMTAMPEAVLARELGLGYMTLALSVNYAAGVQEGVISHDDIHQAYQTAGDKLYALLPDLLQQLPELAISVPELITV